MSDTTLRYMPQLPRYELLDVAENIGDSARQFYGLTSPFDTERWCDLLGVRLFVRAGPHEGRYTRPDGQPCISLSANAGPGRANFTAAHELGHHLLEECRRDPDLRRSLNALTRHRLAHVPPASDLEEQLCDVLAGALLISRLDVHVALSDRGPSIQALKTLCDVFGMSHHAALVRIAEVSGARLAYLSCLADSHTDSWRVRRVIGRAWPLAAPARLYIIRPGMQAVSGSALWSGARRWALAGDLLAVDARSLEMLVTDVRQVPAAPR